MQFFEKNISQFIENQFPSFYKEDGPVFISFVKAYYEWLEQEKNAIYHSRRLLEYKDIDSTTSEFISFFKKKYLNSIQFDTATNTEQFIKHSLDLYRSKGTERSLDLFFKLVFGKPAEIYYPSTDIFRASDGEWIQPKYLEVSYTPNLNSYVNKTIEGISSGTITYVEKYIKKRNNGKDIHLFYVSNIFGNFITGESLKIQNSNTLGPKLLGSLNSLDVIYGGSNYQIGDIVDIYSNTQGFNAKARVANISSVSGINEFQLIDGGWGYSNNTEVLVSDKVLYINNISISDYTNRKGSFIEFETILQPLANIIFFDYTGEIISDNDLLFRYNSNGISGKAEVLSSSYINDNTGVASLSLYDGNFGLDYTFSLENNDDLINENGILLSYNNYRYNSLYGQNLLDEESNIMVFENDEIFITETYTLFKMYEFSYEDDILIHLENEDILLSEFYGSATINSFEDTSASANLIKNSANLTINVIESFSPFSNGSILYQVNTTSNNIIFSATILSSDYIGSNATINLINSKGLIQTNEKIYSNSTVYANLINSSSTIGMVDITNSFRNDLGNYIIGINSNTISNVTRISSGNGAEISISNNFIYPENISYNTDYIRNYLNIPLNGIYNFSNFPSSNLNTVISQSLSYSNIILGTISSLITLNPGSNYDTSPMIVFYDPISFNLNKYDYSISYSNATASFSSGESIRHIDNVGAIKTVSSNTLNIKRTSISEIENYFSLENDYATRILLENDEYIKNEMYITGISSGTSAYVNSIINDNNMRIGFNAEATSNVIIGSGVVTQLDIVDTGFGYNDNTLVYFSGQTYNANGTAIARVFNTGKSIGYYNLNNSELSSNKKLHDNFYYQDYSYVIKSAVTLDKYKDMLDNILHMAGTKYFSEFIFQEESNINTNISNTEVELI